jgi:hypothetical protein
MHLASRYLRRNLRVPPFSYSSRKPAQFDPGPQAGIRMQWLRPKIRSKTPRSRWIQRRNSIEHAVNEASCHQAEDKAGRASIPVTRRPWNTNC